jgi:sugar lactone lactonase YvrE
VRVHRNVLGVGEVGGAINLAADGDNLILVSWVDNDVRVWDPASGKILERYSNLQAPVAAVRYAGQLLATEHGTNRVISLAADGVRGVFAMTSPSGLVVHAGALYVTDRESGSVYQLGANNQLLAAPQQVITGLVTPEGIASLGADFVIVEGATGHIKRVTLDGAQTLLATIPAGTPAPGPAQPPSMVFNGVAVGPDGTIYATGETSRKLYTITESLGSE